MAEVTSSSNELGVAAVLEKTLQDTLALARAEIALAKKEVLAQARALGSSAVLLLAGFVFLQAAITTLGVLLVLLLGATALGFVIVGGLLLIAAVLALVGLRGIRQIKLHSVERAELDVREIAEAVK